MSVVDDVDQGDLDRRILGFTFADDEKKASEVKLTIDSPERRFHDSEIWRPGTLFDVQWAMGGLVSAARRVVVPVNALTGSMRRFRVKLHEVGILMATVPRGTRRFDDVTASEVVDIVAGENSFGADFRAITETTHRFSTITRRADETDGAFLVRLARLQRNFVFWVDHRGLHWGPRDIGQPPIVRIGLGGLIGDVRIGEIKPDRPARMSIAARDRAAKRAIREAADNALDPIRPGLGAVTALGSSVTTTAESLGIDPASVLNVGRLIASGASVRERVDPETGETTTIIASGVAPEERVAKSKVERAARPGDGGARGGYREAQIGAVALSFKFRGNPYVLAKTVVELDVGDKRLSGRYWVNSSFHNPSDGQHGYTVKVKAISDGHGGHSTTVSTTFDLGRAGRGRTGRTQDFDSAAREVENLLIIMRPVSRLNSDFVAVVRDLERDVRRLRARKPGSIQRARRSVSRAKNIGSSAKVPIVAHSAGFVQQRLNEITRGETLSTAAQSTSEVDDGELKAIETVDPERGTVIRYRERSGD